MRRLATVCVSFSAAVFAALYLLPFSWTLWLGVVFGVCALLLFLAKRLWLRPFALAALGLMLGFGCFYLHEMRTTLPARLLDGATREVRATVLDYPQVYERYCRVTVRVEDAALPRVKALVYDESMTLANVEPGDRVRFTAKLSSADRKYGEDYEVYLARDIYFKLNTASKAVVEGRGTPLRYLPIRLHHALTARIAQLFPADTAAFMKSLMLGDKSELYADEGTYLALSRAGNMHALAVSGLHIAYLVGLMTLLFGRRAFSSLCCIALVWGFVLLTGGSPSAVRAAVMQTVMLMAPVLRRENDPPTSLSFALSLILFANPRAGASVSLQLSFAAMAGILCFGESLRDGLLSYLPEGRVRSLLAGPTAAVASSLAVIPFTAPLMAAHFGYVSLLAPLSGALCYAAISLCFLGGYLACLASLLFAPLGAALAWAGGWFARYIVFVSRLVSGIPCAAVYSAFRYFVPWLVGAYVLFLLFRFLPLKRGEKLLLPAAITVLALLVLLNVERLRYERPDGSVSVLDVGQGLCVCAMAGDSTVVVDCGSLMTLDNAGDLAGRFLLSRGRREADALILTHLDSDHINGMSMLLEMLPVRLLILPEGEAPDNTKLEEILQKAAEKAIPIHYLTEDAELCYNALSLTLSAPLDNVSSNDAGLFAAIHIGDYDALVTGDASAALERRWLLHALPMDSELLVVGHHGSKYASDPAFLRFTSADTAIVSVGYNSYGHPTQETLERLADAGYTVYRTDTDGTITIFIEDGHGKKER